MQQCMRLMTYKESATAAICEIERLRHENAMLRSGARPPSEQDRELKEVYRRLGNTKHGWNHTRMLLDISREELETHAHGLSTLSTTWRCRMLSLRRGQR
jgi:FtsZ-binding cell division protein ZapB